MKLKTGSAIGLAALIGVGLYVFAGLKTGEPARRTSQTAPAVSAPAQAGAEMVKVVVPDLTGAARMGERAFNARCASCHGKNAAGRQGIAPPLVHDYYKPSHHGDGAFFMAARNGVRSHHWRFGDMPPVQGITDAEIKTIVAYVRALQKKNGIF